MLCTIIPRSRNNILLDSTHRIERHTAVQALCHRHDDDAAPTGLLYGIEEYRGDQTAASAVHLKDDTLEANCFPHNDIHDAVVEIGRQTQYHDLCIYTFMNYKHSTSLSNISFDINTSLQQAFTFERDPRHWKHELSGLLQVYPERGQSGHVRRRECVQSEGVELDGAVRPQ